MSDPSGAPVPEPPPLVVWALWIARFILGDPAVIVRSWRVILLSSFLLGGAFWYWNRTQYETKIANLESAEVMANATITNQNSTIVLLHQQLESTQKIAEPAVPRDTRDPLATLKARELNFARSLRAFETNFRISDSQADAEAWTRMTGESDKDKKNDAWNKYTSSQRVRSEKHKADFVNNYRSDALKLDDDLHAALSRLGIIPAFPPTSSLAGTAEMVLRDNMLAGPSPLIELADYFDFLARWLPSSKAE